MIRRLALAGALVVFVLSLSTSRFSASPCGAQAACPEPAATGTQPHTNELQDLFLRAATNNLGTLGPALPLLYKGYPPSISARVSPFVPCILLKAIAAVENGGKWKQFEGGQTVVSGDCGYGLMQVTAGMDGSDPGMIPHRVAAEPAYNIGAGARILMKHWNALAHSVGDNDPNVVEDWYFAVWAYNGYYHDTSGRLAGGKNHPLHPANDVNRGTWLCDQNTNQDRSKWPYQELVWGCAANPPIDPDNPSRRLWEPILLTLPPRSSFTYDPNLPEDAEANFPPLHILHPLPANTGCGVVTLPATYRAVCAEPLQNGGFEGPFFQGWSRTNNILLATVAQDGNYSALMGGYVNSNPDPYSVPVDVLSQTFTVPNINIEGQPSAASLSFYYAATTTEPIYPYADLVWVYIRDSSGRDSGPHLVSYDLAHPSVIVWKQVTIGLDSYRGQTITVRFALHLDSNYPSTFYIDSVRVQACEAREP